MIKGVNKQIIEVSDTKSEYFEKVLFFVKPRYYGEGQSKLTADARRYISEYTAPEAFKNGYLRKCDKRRRRITALICALGLISVALVMFLVLKY